MAAGGESCIVFVAVRLSARHDRRGKHYDFLWCHNCSVRSAASLNFVPDIPITDSMADVSLKDRLTGTCAIFVRASVISGIHGLSDVDYPLHGIIQNSSSHRSHGMLSIYCEKYRPPIQTGRKGREITMISGRNIS